MIEENLRRIHWEGYFSYHDRLLSVWTDGKKYYVLINGEWKEISKNQIEESYDDE